MIQPKSRKYLLIALLLASGVASAQFQNRAKIDTVSRPGFYAIKITPVLSSLTRTDFRDTRIVDQAGNPIPYLIGSEWPAMDSARFIPLKITQNNLNDSGQTVLIVQNGQNTNLDGFYIRMKNAAVSRTLALSGSNDGIKWYSIIENLSLDKQFIQNQDNFQEYISFPLSSYRYFRVIIFNGKNDPLDIISVEKPAGKTAAPKDAIVMNPAGSFLRKDSSKISWITINNLQRFHIINVLIKVESPRFYKRQLEVWAGQELKGSFLISSDSLVSLALPSFNDSVFEIRIYNEDNPPLVISGISTGQHAEKLIAYLEPGKSYQLEMTNPTAAPPHYDLGNFKDSIPKDIPEIGVSEMVFKFPAKDIKDNSPRQPWLWPMLIFALIVLGLLTYGLTRDLAKKS